MRTGAETNGGIMEMVRLASWNIRSCQGMSAADEDDILVVASKNY